MQAIHSQVLPVQGGGGSGAASQPQPQLRARGGRQRRGDGVDGQDGVAGSNAGHLDRVSYIELLDLLLDALLEVV